MKQRHFIDGEEVETPLNYADLAIELNYDVDGNSQAISVNNWDWGVGDRNKQNDGYLRVKKHSDDGLSFVGLPHRVELDNEDGTSYVLFDGYTDVGKAQFFHDKITTPSTEKGKLDWLNDVSDGISFAYLESIGKIKDTDFIKIPYCINKKQNAYEIIITVLTLFVVADKIKEQISTISEMTSSAGNQFEATVIIKLVLRILYILALLASVIGLVIKLYNMLIQPVKYHYGMYVGKQIEKGLEYFGLKLSSSILQKAPYNKMAILPEKYKQTEQTGIFDGIQGVIDSTKLKGKGYYNGTFGELLRSMKQMFNAKIIIQDNVLYFEKFDLKLSTPIYTLPDLWDARYEYTQNIDECKSNFLLTFQTDNQDKNTVQEYKGTSVQVTTSLSGTVDKQLNLLNGLQEVRIPFALGKRKKELNTIEKLINEFYKAMGATIEALITVVNAILIVINVLIALIQALIKAVATIGLKLNFKIKTIEPIEVEAFKNLVEDRINMLVMESDFVNIPKLILINNGNARANTLLPTNEIFINARYLFDNNHYFSSFIGRKNWIGNQFLIKRFENIPFTFDDYEKVRVNNEMYDFEGNELKLLSLRFNSYEGTAEGTYKQQKAYATNLKEFIYEPE